MLVREIAQEARRQRVGQYAWPSKAFDVGDSASSGKYPGSDVQLARSAHRQLAAYACRHRAGLRIAGA
eukprot:3260585-Rhodomonas_salina.10